MRLKNIFRNSFFSMAAQLVILVMGFLCRRVMNLELGEELVGVNGVICNIISILSVTELGISTAIVYHLYGAIAREDEEEISGLMNMYQKAYYIFALLVGILGLIVLPFVHIFMKDTTYSVEFIRGIYLLYLIKTVLSYVLFCKRSLLIADQKEYIVSIITLFINLLNYSGTIILIKATGNYAASLVLNIVIECALNLWIVHYVNQKYPYLRRNKKAKIKKSLKDQIVRDLKNIFFSKVSQKILVCTDNLIISGFISVATVGLYNNYCLITQTVGNILTTLANTFQPTFGNLFTEKDNTKNYHALRQITFFFFLVDAVAASGLMALITPFVTDFWLGKAYELSFPVVVFCVVVCAVQVIGLPLSIVMGVSGLFQKERNISIVTAILNLVLSLALVKPLGSVGVLIGTFSAYVVQIPYRVKVFFCDFLKQKPSRYIFDLLEYSVLITAEAIFVYWIVHQFYTPGILQLLMALLVCVFVPTAINMLLYSKSWRLKSVLKMIPSLRSAGTEEKAIK